MSDGVIKILDKLGEKFGLAIDWSSQNIIPYLQELMGRYVSLCNAKAITWIILSSILLVLSLIGLIKLFKTVSVETIDDDEASASIAAVLIMVALGSLVVIFCNVFGLYENIFTPELVFLDYIKSMCGGI